MVAKNSRKKDVERFASNQGGTDTAVREAPREMSPAPHIIPTVKALMAGYPKSHVDLVIDAIRKGPRVKTTDLAKKCGVSLRTVWKWIKAGKIPQPKKQGRKLRYWDYGDVAHLIDG